MIVATQIGQDKTAAVLAMYFLSRFTFSTHRGWSTSVIVIRHFILGQIGSSGDSRWYR